MNVRPGDLAVIIKTGLPETAANIGAIVSVIEWCGCGSWLVESRGRRLLGFTLTGLASRERVCVYDESLRPITPPGATTDIQHHETETA